MYLQFTSADHSFLDCLLKKAGEQIFEMKKVNYCRQTNEDFDAEMA